MWDYAGQITADGAISEPANCNFGFSQQISVEPNAQIHSSIPVADQYESGEWHCAVIGYGPKGCAAAALKGLQNSSFTSKLIDSESFAVLAWKNDGTKTYLATDRFSSLPICYSTLGETLSFSSKPSLTSKLIDSQKLNVQALFQYAFFHVIPGPESVFEGISKVPPSTVLTWDGNTSLQRYYTPTFEENRSGPSEQQALLDSLQTATTRCASKSDGKVGAFLSGGLDSSSVVGMLSRCSESQAEAFTIGFEAEGYDEIPFARATAKHFGVKLHEHYLTQDEVLQSIPELAQSFGEPFGNSSSVPGYICAKFAASNGVTRLLAGDGGDELFAGNERYAKQKVFEPFATMPPALQNSILSLANKIPAAMTPGLLNKPRRYIQRAALPTPDRLHSHNFIALHGHSTLFNEQFLEQVSVDKPLQMARSVFDQPENASTLNRMLYTDWQFVLADNDLVKVGTTCRAAGIEVRYPMLNDEVVDLSCRISSRDKLPGNKLRHFYKESCRGFLADSTLNKSKKGFGLPFGIWLRDHAGLREIASDSLSGLKERGIYKPEFIDETQRLHQEEHAAYYGELVWIMMMLEQWFEHHNPSWTL